MNIEEIEKVIEGQPIQKGVCVKIRFKQRDSLRGLFVRHHDYQYLKGKNFWRIVSETKIANYKITQDINLTKLFNGAEFSKLTAEALAVK